MLLPQVQHVQNCSLLQSCFHPTQTFFRLLRRSCSINTYFHLAIESHERGSCTCTSSCLFAPVATLAVVLGSKLWEKLFCLSQDWWGLAIFSPSKYSPTPLVAIQEVGFVKKLYGKQVAASYLYR